MRSPGNLARTFPARLMLTAGACLALAGGALSVATMTGATPASAALSASARPASFASAASSAAGKSAVVVRERTRPHFGKILVTVHGAALYYLPHGSCTGQCLSIWPRLVMPAGKTRPKGASCLGTSPFGTRHRLEVTYRGKRLYTFSGDSGTSVNGNGVAGFMVAKVLRSC
jgi:predicted lipoprotein with Yx(FWY)xxD motif